MSLKLKQTLKNKIIPILTSLFQVVGRYFMGYYPSKICTLLNIVLMVGYCTIDCIIGGQVLSAVSGGTMTIAVGVVVVAIVVLVIAVFGLKVFNEYER
jgi:purine-cytosine permease-like protein